MDRCPNDDSANEQLDIGHHVYLMLLDNKLFLAPIPPHPQKVLDVATGTGTDPSAAQAHCFLPSR
jgi:ubiquinone/menaquinone biosynthesis C-methylase UbiE